MPIPSADNSPKPLRSMARNSTICRKADSICESTWLPGTFPKATEVIGRQYHPDDEHRAKDQDRHADIYHRL
jgi:hypothetical protein